MPKFGSNITKSPSLQPFYEDDWLIAFEKPSGVVSVPAPNIPEYKTFQGIIRAWATDNACSFKPYLLHRLDRDTSGILLFGKYAKDRVSLENIFADPRTNKTYLALVKWVPKNLEGVIKFPLEARTENIKVPAVSHYKVLKKMDSASLVEVCIETGRKHQIRKHMAMIGHPLILDREYGDFRFDSLYQKKNKGRAKFTLHSWKLDFFHPFLKEIVSLSSDNLAKSLLG